MSALDGWIDICRTGTHRSMSGRDFVFATADLDAMVQNFQQGDPVPVVVGHPETDAPAYAWLEGVRRVGDRLQARLRDIAPEFRLAVESGRYTGRSVAIHQPRTDGRTDGWSLLHLGFLGAAAPAVSGLTPTQFAAPPDAVITFAASDSERMAWYSLARVFRRLREHFIERDGLRSADAVVPEYEIDAIAEAGVDEQDGGTTVPFSVPPSAPTESVMAEMDTHTPDAAAFAATERVALAEARAACDRDRATLDTARAQLAAEARQRACEDALSAHVQAGRVLPAERAALVALMAALPDGEATLSFASAAAGGEVRTSPRKVFEDFLAALPRRVDYREHAAAAAFSGAAAPQDNSQIAARARAYRAAQALSGRRITAAGAVDAVVLGLDLPRSTQEVTA